MLDVELCGVKLRNPTVLASGFLGTSADLLKRVAANGAGAVTTKSIGPVEHPGHNNPTVVEVENGIYNAVGLSTPGYRNIDYSRWKELSVPLIASVYGSTVDDYVKIAKHIEPYKPSIIELNVSCPNKDDGMAFGINRSAMRVLVKKLKDAVSIPIMPKLTPNCRDIGEIAAVCENAGADAISAINTVQKKIVHPQLKQPILAYGKGGISGPAIKKVALEKVKEIRAAVDLPIVAYGGVAYGKDALDMLKAGATAVGIGSGIYFRGMDVFKKVCDEMIQKMKKEKYSSIEELGK